MQTTIYAIINGITADLKKDGFLDKDIEIAVVTAKKYYNAFLEKQKN